MRELTLIKLRQWHLKKSELFYVLRFQNKRETTIIKMQISSQLKYLKSY